MSILTAEEAGSSSMTRLNRCQHYVNRDREAAYLRLWHYYFNDDCVYPIILLSKVPYTENSFRKHYAQVY
jgi:hypothetical protein